MLPQQWISLASVQVCFLTLSLNQMTSALYIIYYVVMWDPLTSFNMPVFKQDACATCWKIAWVNAACHGPSIADTMHWCIAEMSEAEPLQAITDDDHMSALWCSLPSAANDVHKNKTIIVMLIA